MPSGCACSAARARDDRRSARGRLLLRPRQPLFVPRLDPDPAPRGGRPAAGSAGGRSTVSTCSRRVTPTRSGAEPVSGQYERAYRRFDAECWADYYGVPFREPKDLWFAPERLGLAATAAARLGAVEGFSRRLFQAIFVDGDFAPRRRGLSAGRERGRARSDGLRSHARRARNRRRPEERPSKTRWRPACSACRASCSRAGSISATTGCRSSATC